MCLRKHSRSTPGTSKNSKSITSESRSGSRRPSRSTSRLSFPPFEFFAEELEISSRWSLDESEDAIGSPYSDDVAAMHGVSVLAVIRHEHIFCAVGRLGVDLNLGVAGDHNGTIGQRVRC